MALEEGTAVSGVSGVRRWVACSQFFPVIVGAVTGALCVVVSPVAIAFLGG